MYVIFQTIYNLFIYRYQLIHRTHQHKVDGDEALVARALLDPGVNDLFDEANRDDADDAHDQSRAVHQVDLPEELQIRL